MLTHRATGTVALSMACHITGTVRGKRHIPAGLKVCIGERTSHLFPTGVSAHAWRLLRGTSHQLLDAAD